MKFEVKNNAIYIIIPKNEILKYKVKKKWKKVRWKSSKPGVVSVSAKGKITAKKAGTAIVYAYMQDGTYAKIKVTVK